MTYSEAVKTLTEYDHANRTIRREAWKPGVCVRRTLAHERGNFGTYVRCEGKKESHFIVTGEDVDANDWAVQEKKAPESAEKQPEPAGEKAPTPSFPDFEPDDDGGDGAA